MHDQAASGRMRVHFLSTTSIFRIRGCGAWRIALAALAAAGLYGPWSAVPVQAQQVVAEAPADLGVIVVQARRRDEKIVDAPVAVTVETGEQLKDQNAVLFDDIAREVPNLRMMPSPQSVSAMDVTMRGQTAIRSAIDYDPAVGIYVDGIYVANGQAAMNTLLDIDTVEIVRGAQGTLFGRNNTGGSISFNTNRPQLGVYSAELAADAGYDRLFVGRGIFNVPVGDTVALRLAYQDNQRDGYGSSAGSGQGNFDNQHRYQVRLGALWRPDPGFNAYWTYEHFEANEVGALLHPLHGTFIEQLGQLYNSVPQIAQIYPTAGLSAVAPFSVPDNFFQTGAGFGAHDNTHLDATQLTLSRMLDADTKAKLILGYRHLGNDTAIDVDASTLPFADTALQNASSQKSVEFQLAGTALERRLDWVGGLYWFRDDGSAPSVLQAAPLAYPTNYAILQGLTNPQTGQPFLPPGNAPFSPYPVVESNSIQNLSHAAFVHGEYHVNERWAVAAGLRRTDDTRKLSENDYADAGGGVHSCTIGSLTPGQACNPLNQSVGFSYWSWEFSSRYRFSDELGGYFRTGRGQRSGGWNAPVSGYSDKPFAPEQITDYELGLKADLLGGAMLVNGDVFLGNYDQMQRLLPQIAASGTPTTTVINAGRARVSGAEFEGDLRLSRSWSLRAALGWTDAHYKEFVYNPGGGLPAMNLSGNEFYQTPKLNAGLGAGYELGLLGGYLRVHADYAWQDRVQFNVINDFNNQASYGTLNARAAYAGASNSWEVALFGTNLANRQYAITGGTVAIAGSSLPATSWQIPGAPRLYGVEFTYRFGPHR